METKSWFFKRGYPKGLVQKELRKVKFSDKVGGKQKKKENYPLCYYISTDFEEYW